MKVLITGSNGFIGRNLTDCTGWDGVDIHECNIRHEREVYKTLEDYDTVIHLAGLTGVEQSLENEANYVDNNINGTHNIALVCCDMGVRLIFASSSSIYEAKSPYAKTKQGCEDIINAFNRHGLNSLILRLFTVFGEHNRRDMAVYKFTQAIRNRKPIELYGDCRRDFTYVGDVCKAIEKLAPMNITGTYDLGFGNSMPVMEMIRAIAGIIGQETTVEQKPQRDFDAKATKADPELMERLNIEPTPLDEALKRTLETI